MQSVATIEENSNATMIFVALPVLNQENTLLEIGEEISLIISEVQTELLSKSSKFRTKFCTISTNLKLNFNLLS